MSDEYLIKNTTKQQRKYEFTNYKWGDPEGEEKAVKLYEDKLGTLTALEEQ